MARLRMCFAVVLMLVLMGVLVLQFNVQSVRAGPKTMVVPEKAYFIVRFFKLS
jgi:hypothetical protein